MTEQSIITAAYEYAKTKHRGQLDDSGLDYFEAHIKPVAAIVMMIANGDDDLVAAAYLHDTLEDTETDYSALKVMFGQRIADLVVELTKAGTRQTGYYFPHLKSRDAILIKFADRLSNLSRMDAWDAKRQDQYIRKSKFWRSE